MRKVPEPKKNTPHTKAHLAFEENLEFIALFISLRRRELAATKAVTLRLDRSAKRLTSPTPSNIKRVAAIADRIAKAKSTMMQRQELVSQWEVVILVTCVEAYLQDVLSAAAKLDPELMSKSEHVARYADVVAAASLEALGDDLRSQWARGWLNNGGPTRWLFRLQQLGARGYPTDLASRLERIWGIRHLVIHSAGVANAEFVKLHPGVAAGPGECLSTIHLSFPAFAVAVKEFQETTEQFFLARFPALAVTAGVS